jgi:pimeloyl-ACP methyl ester carboxylesterase
MVLHVREWGDGDRVAVLIHGMAGDGDDWAPVAPLIAARGCRVVAIDLPGHGRSPATPGATFEGLAASVAEATGASPEVMIGHSMGAVVLAVGITTGVLHPQRAVYVDCTFVMDPDDGDRPALVRLLSRIKEERTPRAPETASWDVETTADAWVGVAGQDLTPPAHAVPSLLVRAEPSSYATPEVVRDLAARGFTISSVPGATHNVWYDGRERAFVDALGDWL